MRQWQDGDVDRGSKGKAGFVLLCFILFIVDSIRACLSATGRDPGVKAN